ncbi:MAG: DNA mismatch repair protein MutS, partial [Desulfitobacterium hafniense]|nr:DNA mismatch repair protein MutS [Desulfitobacterium hafniense]
YQENEWGLAFIDVSTGEFTVFQTPVLDILLTELSRIRPSELLLPLDLVSKHKHWLGYFITSRDRVTFDQVSVLTERFPNQKTILQDLSAAAKAASCLWQYLGDNIPGLDPSHIFEIRTYRQDQWMLLDQWTRRNLELTEPLRGQGRKGTLMSVLDLTKTAFGGRLLKRWIEQPLVCEKLINERLDTIQDLTNNAFLRSDLSKQLTNVYDLERLLGRVSYGNTNARDLLAIKNTLKTIPFIRELIDISETTSLKRYVASLQGLDELAQNLENSLNPDSPSSVKEGGIIKTGFSPQIDELRSISSGGKEWLARLESTEKERTGIRSLKVGYNKVFGYYIEVTHANSHLIPDDYIRKQTLANAERFITPELKVFEQKILEAEDKLIQLEYDLFIQLREEVRNHAKHILEMAKALAEIDVFVSLAEVAVRNNYTRPLIKKDGTVKIIEGRHPVVENMLPGGTFVPNDTVLSFNNHLALITGPNMAGKSTYMRQVALIVLMAHIGSFVPAQKASISVVDHIFTRVGASDDLASGQSTFMVEMKEVSYILNHVTDNSLVILDEVGRGTATFDGLSIAWAIAEYLGKEGKIKPKTLFATHYHELTQLEESIPGIFNLHVSVREHGEEIIFLYKIVQGRADRSYGIQVARLAGLPPTLIAKAKILLHQFEQSQLDKLEQQKNTPIAQLTIFDTPEVHPLLKEIETLPIEDITPRQALQYLFDLRDRIKSYDK